MAETYGGTTTLTMPSDREIAITRVFDAPRELVFEALTTPEHVTRWYGLRSMSMPVCEIDLRPGGAWRFVMRDANGNDFAFSGVYQEVVPPERLVSTEGWEALPGHEYVATVTLDEQDGRTTLRSHLQYQSAEDRDGHLRSGMEGGMRESYDRLAEFRAEQLAKM